MDNSVVRCADEIIDICHELKALLSVNGAFDAYKLKLLGRLQRLSLSIGLDDEREDEKLGDIMAAQFAKKNKANIPNDLTEQEKQQGFYFREVNGNAIKFSAETGEMIDGQPKAMGGNSSVSDMIKQTIDRNEARKKYPRKGNAVCEERVTFKNHGLIGKDKDGHVVTHFNHDENTMKVTVQVNVKDRQGRKFKICKGKIEHLTIFAADGVGRGVDVADELADKVGGTARGWKHSKGIGTVVDKSGKQYKADLHWFENPEVGQCCWKIKEFLDNMKETDKYW